MTPSTERSMLPVRTTRVNAMPTMSGTALASAIAEALAHVKNRGLINPTPRHSPSSISSGANCRSRSAGSPPRSNPVRGRSAGASFGDSVSVDTHVPPSVPCCAFPSALARYYPPGSERSGAARTTLAALRGWTLHPLPDVIDLVIRHNLDGRIVVLLRILLGQELELDLELAVFWRLLQRIKLAHIGLVRNNQPVITLAGALLRNRGGVLALDDALNRFVRSVDADNRNLTDLARGTQCLDRAKRHLVVRRPDSGDIRMGDEQVLHHVEALGAIPVGVLFADELDTRCFLHRLLEAGSTLDAGRVPARTKDRDDLALATHCLEQLFGDGIALWRAVELAVGHPVRRLGVQVLVLDEKRHAIDASVLAQFDQRCCIWGQVGINRHDGVLARFGQKCLDLRDLFLAVAFREHDVVSIAQANFRGELLGAFDPFHVERVIEASDRCTQIGFFGARHRWRRRGCHGRLRRRCRRRGRCSWRGGGRRWCRCGGGRGGRLGGWRGCWGRRRRCRLAGRRQRRSATQPQQGAQPEDVAAAKAA